MQEGLHMYFGCVEAGLRIIEEYHPEVWEHNLEKIRAFEELATRIEKG